MSFDEGMRFGSLFAGHIVKYPCQTALAGGVQLDLLDLLRSLREFQSFRQ